MSDGLYTAASGGLYALRSIEVVSNNLANVNTVGFKGQRLISRQQEFADTLTSKLKDSPERAESDFDRAPGVVDINTVTDFSQGPIQQTGNPLNVALTNPNQFFVIQTPNGDAYTRAGNFTLDSSGALVTQDGLPVLGDGGPLVSPPEGSPSISNNGSIIVNNEAIGRIKVVEIDNLESLTRTEGVRFQIQGDGQARPVTDAMVVPGSVEMPNVTVVTSIIDMISAQKSFEAYAKIAKDIDSLNEQAIRQAGR